MRKLFLFTSIIISSLSLQAQFDSTHRDTTFAAYTEGVTELMHAPVLTRTEDQIHIVPHQQFCFDVMMDVELNFGGVSRETAVFLNTTDGYIGYTPPSRGGAINIIMPEVESFAFTVVSYKLGNVYMFRNQKASRGDDIDHILSTSNTEAHNYQEENMLAAAPLSRKTERREYCNGNMRATAYKRSDENTTWFIYGGDYDTHHVMPQTLTVLKYVGAFGVGIIQTDWGAFIVTERQMGSSYTVIKNIERVHVCFDPSEFKMAEQDYYNKAGQDLDAESSKIDQDEAEISHHDHCQSEEMDLINFRRQNVQAQRGNLQTAQSGNLLQNTAAQRGMLGMMDPSTMVQESILQTKINICNIEHDMSLHPDDASLQDRLDCNNRLLGQLQEAKTQMDQIDHQYPNPAEAIARKSRLMLTVQSQGCN